MARQWIRSCELTVGSGSDALDLLGLHVSFEVRYATAQYPTFADITVENPSDQTVNRVQKELSAVTLKAGYAENSGLIFKGEAVYKRAGRASPTETYLNLLCKSGDRAYKNATVSKTLAAGHTFNDQLQVALDAMKREGIEIGHVAQLDGRKMPRGITLFGMARDVLRRVCIANNASWTIHNGKVQVTKNGDGLPGDTIVLNSRTGLIGRPVQTFQGIEVRCLLNPRISPGCKIKIDEKAIERVRLSPDYSDRTVQDYAPGLATDGVYRVIAVRHIGDTRENTPWFTEMSCLNLGDVRGLPAETNLEALEGLPVLEQTAPQQSAGGQ